MTGDVKGEARVDVKDDVRGEIGLNDNVVLNDSFQDSTIEKIYKPEEVDNDVLKADSWKQFKSGGYKDVKKSKREESCAKRIEVHGAQRLIKSDHKNSPPVVIQVCQSPVVEKPESKSLNVSCEIVQGKGMGTNSMPEIYNMKDDTRKRKHKCKKGKDGKMVKSTKHEATTSNKEDYEVFGKSRKFEKDRKSLKDLENERKLNSIESCQTLTEKSQLMKCDKIEKGMRDSNIENEENGRELTQNEVTDKKYRRMYALLRSEQSSEKSDAEKTAVDVEKTAVIAEKSVAEADEMNGEKNDKKTIDTKLSEAEKVIEPLVVNLVSKESDGKDSDNRFKDRDETSRKIDPSAAENPSVAESSEKHEPESLGFEFKPDGPNVGNQVDDSVISYVPCLNDDRQPAENESFDSCSSDDEPVTLVDCNTRQPAENECEFVSLGNHDSLVRSIDAVSSYQNWTLNLTCELKAKFGIFVKTYGLKRNLKDLQNLIVYRADQQNRQTMFTSDMPYSSKQMKESYDTENQEESKIIENLVEKKDIESCEKSDSGSEKGNAVDESYGLNAETESLENGDELNEEKLETTNMEDEPMKSNEDCDSQEMDNKDTGIESELAEDIDQEGGESEMSSGKHDYSDLEKELAYLDQKADKDGEWNDTEKEAFDDNDVLIEDKETGEVDLEVGDIGMLEFTRRESKELSNKEIGHIEKDKDSEFYDLGPDGNNGEYGRNKNEKTLRQETKKDMQKTNEIFENENFNNNQTVKSKKNKKKRKKTNPHSKSKMEQAFELSENNDEKEDDQNERKNVLHKSKHNFTTKKMDRTTRQSRNPGPDVEVGLSCIKRKYKDYGLVDFKVQRPAPKVPKPHCCFPVCSRGRRRRHYKSFDDGNYGRQCSDSGGSSGGDRRSSWSEGKSGSNRTGSSSNDNENSNCEQENSDNGNQNNNNNNNQNGGRDGKQNIPNNNAPTLTQQSRTPPLIDYKRYRKKVHADVSDLEFTDTLGKIGREHTDSGGQPVFINNPDVALCVANSLQYIDDMTDDILNCKVCSIINSLLKHFANCVQPESDCSMCVQVFWLICSHIHDCANNNESVSSILSGDRSICTIQLCMKITSLLDGKDISAQWNVMWYEVKRTLARSIDGITEEVEAIESPKITQHETTFPSRPVRVSSTMRPALMSIPEGQPLSLSSPSNSRILMRKKSNLARVGENDGREKKVDGTPQDSADAAVIPSPFANEKEEEFTRPVEKQPYARAERGDEIHEDTVPSAPHDEMMSGGSSGGSGMFAAAQGSRFTSLPMGPPGPNNAYFPSMKEKPTGIRGIDEVVYDDKTQLVKVVDIWAKFKTQYMIEAKLARHYREEGVILREFKDYLCIKGLRYNNNFQWVKVAHLGNGMTGKCHLATDFETDFKFCVKELHISNYEKEEIELWSELDHPYIVQVYGAIRHGENIYILQEFIQGGCLTEAINAQRKLGRRLSQLTALRYFKQLLEVLIYLKSRNILHEDLKADNILLNNVDGKITIKVTDFGMAKRVQGVVRKKTPPVGTQTQWSPEKAKAVGYGFPAEVWAGVCVLIHMLSGQPPWMKRYENLGALILVIVEQSPPIEDIPRNVDQSVRDLICQGFTVCQGQRPPANKLLKHEAFNLLREADYPTNTSLKYSMLDPPFFDTTNKILYENVDLKTILKNLEAIPHDKEKEKALHGPPKVNVNPPRQGAKKSLLASKGDTSVHKGLQRQPSYPGENVNPMSHINRFYYDDFIASEQTSLIVMPAYQPDDDSNIANTYPEEGFPSDPSVTTSEEVLIGILPKFDQIANFPKDELFPTAGDFNVHHYDDDDDSDDDGNRQNTLDNFDVDKALLQLQQEYLLPNTSILNTSQSVEFLSETSVSETESSINRVALSMADDANSGISQNVLDAGSSNRLETMQKANNSDTELNERFTSFNLDNDDLLFISGSPPTTSLDHVKRHDNPTLEPIQEAITPKTITPSHETPRQIEVGQLYQQTMVTSSPNARNQPNISTGQSPRVTMTTVPINSPYTLANLPNMATIPPSMIGNPQHMSTPTSMIGNPQNTVNAHLVGHVPDPLDSSMPYMRTYLPNTATNPTPMSLHLSTMPSNRSHIAHQIPDQSGMEAHLQTQTIPNHTHMPSHVYTGDRFPEPRPNQSLNHYCEEHFRNYRNSHHSEPTNQERDHVFGALERDWHYWQQNQPQRSYFISPHPLAGNSHQMTYPTHAARASTNQYPPNISTQQVSGNETVRVIVEVTTPQKSSSLSSSSTPSPRYPAQHQYPMQSAGQGSNSGFGTIAPTHSLQGELNFTSPPSIHNTASNSTYGHSPQNSSMQHQTVPAQFQRQQLARNDLHMAAEGPGQSLYDPQVHGHALSSYQQHSHDQRYTPYNHQGQGHNLQGQGQSPNHPQSQRRLQYERSRSASSSNLIAGQSHPPYASHQGQSHSASDIYLQGHDRHQPRYTIGTGFDHRYAKVEQNHQRYSPGYYNYQGTVGNHGNNQGLLDYSLPAMTQARESSNPMPGNANSMFMPTALNTVYQHQNQLGIPQGNNPGFRTSPLMSASPRREDILRRELAPTSRSPQQQNMFNPYHWSPAINPRPGVPAEVGVRHPDLRLDINKAQEGPRRPGTTYAATAPVVSPPKMPAKQSPEFQRNMSYVQPTCKVPYVSPNQNTKSSHSSMSRDTNFSASRSQYEEQEELLRELGRTAVDDLSQHSQHSDPVVFLDNDDDLDNELMHSEFEIEDPAQSLAHYLDDEDRSDSLTVTFQYEGQMEKMRFSGDDLDRTWERVINTELNWIPKVFNLECYCLKINDGTAVDLEHTLVAGTVTVLVTPVTDDDNWWVESGGIMIK